MARTTDRAVRDILLESYRCPDSLGPFIATASVITTRVGTCATARGMPLSSEELELIERWIAAHAYAMSHQTMAKKNTADSGATFHGQTKMQLEATKYGQMALSLDPSGCLFAITMRKRGIMVWLGKEPSAQIPYEQRD